MIGHQDKINQILRGAETIKNMNEPLFPRVGLKQVLSEKDRTEQLQMNSKYARNLIDEKTYRDWLKEFEKLIDTSS